MSLGVARDEYLFLRSLKKEDKEALYTIGYALFEDGCYEKAEKIFRKLTISSPLVYFYWMGYAASLQAQKKAYLAIRSYANAAILERGSPYPHLYAAQCLFHLDDLEDSKKALSCAKSLSNSCDKKLLEEIKKIEELLCQQ